MRCRFRACSRPATLRSLPLRPDISRDVHHIRSSQQAAHLRHHLSPGCRQDDADRKAVAVWWRYQYGRHREGPQGEPARNLGLDGAGAAARYFDHFIGHAISLSRPHRQFAGYAGTRGFFRGYLPDPDRSRFRVDGDRLRQRRGGSHHQVDGSLPAARYADPGRSVWAGR